MKYFTRKNPWYTGFLLVTQLLLGTYALNQGQVFWGAFFFWGSGVNTVHLMHPENGPDVP